MTDPADTAPTKSRRQRILTRLREDRGGSPVEFAIIVAVMIFVTFALAQVALVFYARSVALGAATQGVNAGRGFNAPVDAGAAATRTFLNQAGTGLTNQQVTITRGGQDITVVVTGDAISVLPGITFGIRQSAHGSIEQPS
jgi:Flp pilus assembly protein TadG